MPLRSPVNWNLPFESVKTVSMRPSSRVSCRRSSREGRSPFGRKTCTAGGACARAAPDAQSRRTNAAVSLTLMPFEPAERISAPARFAWTLLSRKCAGAPRVFSGGPWLEVELDSQLDAARVAVDAVADAAEGAVGRGRPGEARRLRADAGRRGHGELERDGVRQVVDVGAQLKVRLLAEVEA